MDDNKATVRCRSVQLDELPRLVEIYARAFPEQLRVRLGKAVCRRCLESAMLDDDCQVCVALVDNQIAGFAIVHLTPAKKSNRFWVLRCWPFVLFSFAREPLYWCRRLLNVAFVALQRDHSNEPTDAVDILPLGQSLIYLDFIGVAPEARRKGVAQVLLTECMIIAKKTGGCQVLRLTVDDANQAAVRLYEGFGFKKVSHHAASHSSVYQIFL